MTAGSDSWRDIGWSGVQLACPRAWETIVSGETHLLFEDDFQPLLELRWQRQGKGAKQCAETVVRKLQRDSGLIPQDSVPPSWQDLTAGFSLRLLTEKKQTGQPRAALLTCRQCATTFLVSFFKNLPVTHPDLPGVLASLKCHDREGESRFWSIQDFQVFLPAGFQLKSYSFAAGLTRLSYVDSSLTMHLCRLTSAAQRLEQAALTDLLTALGDVPVPAEEIRKNAHSVGHVSRPSIFRQIVSRCKRQAPFHWMTLRHHPEYDRLSGLFFFDKRPIPAEMTSSILNSYELFSL